MKWSEGNKKGRGITPAPIANNRRTGNRPTDQSYHYISYMPVDFISGKIIGMELSAILNNPRLSFTQKVNPTTGEILPRYAKDGTLLQPMQMAEHEGMKFEHFLDSNTMYFSGSLHKYWNDGHHNYNNFNYYAFNETIEKMYRELGIKPENIWLSCLEYGVNFTPPIECVDILNGCIEHWGIDVVVCKDDPRGKYHQAEHNKYILKLYDKGKQNGLSENILRIEMKETNWSDNRKKGIRTLADFIECDKIPFVNRLIKKWQEVIFADPTALKKGEYNESETKRYWRELRPRKNRNIKSKRLKELRHLNKTQGENIQGQIVERMIEKIQSLQKVTNSTLREKKVCPVTGCEIVGQRQDSIFLSHTGLQYIRNNNPKQFRQLSHQFLTDHWKNAPVEVQIREIAHNIRNKYYNRRRPTRQTPGIGQIQIGF